MAEQRLNKNAASLQDANWSGAGVADDAELAVIDSEQVHTDLDLTGETTTGVNYMHWRGGRPTVGDDTNGNLKIECKAAYTTRPNFIWATLGGEIHVEFSTTVCKEAVFMAAGGVSFIVAGDCETLKIGGRGVVHVLPGVDIQTNLYVLGQAHAVVQEETGGASVPNCYALEASRLDIDRLVENLTMWHQARVQLDNQSGTGMTALTMHGGLLYPLAGDIPAVTQWGGRIDISRVQEALNLGTGSYVVNGSGLVVPSSNDLVTVGTPTGLLPAVPIGK